MAHHHLRGQKKPRTPGIKKKLKKEARNRSQKAEYEKLKRKGHLSTDAAESKPVIPDIVPKPQVADGPPRTMSKTDRKALHQRQVNEKNHRALYPVAERLLLVGEGNFSFARGLCQNLEVAGGVYATAFDGEAKLNKKYPDAAECRKAVEALGATTLVGVDATRIHKVREFKGAFSKVVWNFPHIGGAEADVASSVLEHQKLLSAFFTSAARCLDPEGASQIHVSLKIGEPYKSWKIVHLARAAIPDFELRTAIPFVTAAWPGYAHRRTRGFDERLSKADSEEIEKGAKVYIFERKKEAAMVEG